MASGVEYSSASLVRIATAEARRGNLDPSMRFSETAVLVRELRDLRAQRRKDYGLLCHVDPDKAREQWAANMKQARAVRRAKAEALARCLESVSADISRRLESGTFSWGVSAGSPVRGRATYRIADENAVYFAAKQLEYSLARVRAHAMPNRSRTVAQLADALAGRAPRLVLRCDIAKFFESIDHDNLMSRLARHGGTSPTTRLLVGLLLDEHRELTGVAAGLPAGVGVSARLAEIYAKPIDEAVRTLPGVIYFGRYVDDIVLVVESISALRLAEDAIGLVLDELSLRLNPKKTEKRAYPALPELGAGSFEFLGYRVSGSQDKPIFQLRDDVRNRIKDRVERSFLGWDKAHPGNTGSQGLLLNRIKYLTGNQKLANSKSSAFVGIHFNSPALTSMKDLEQLDKLLRSAIDARLSIPMQLRNRLLQLSFVEGFESVRFNRFSQEQLVRIVAVWRDA